MTLKKNLYIKLQPGSLAGNTLRLFSGSLFIQIISFLTLPVFSRIYSPSDYGTWSIFIIISGLVSIISCLRYELTLMIPVSNVEANVLLRSAKTINLFVTVVATGVIWVFSDPIADRFSLSNDYLVVLLIPVHAYFTSYNSLMIQWISRRKQFRFLVTVRIVQGLLNIALTFIFGYFLHWNYRGLILATLLSVVVSDILISIKYRSTFYSGFIFSPRHLKKYIVRYKSFALYSTPLAILNYSTANLLTYVLQVNFGAHVTGLYSNAVRLMHTPMSLVSNSFNPVFYQHFSRSENKSRLLVLSFLSLLVVFTFLLLPLIIWGEQLIVYYLGSQWRESAVFIKWLAVITVLSFSMSSVSTVFPFLQKENIVLIWQIVFFAVVLAIFHSISGDYGSAILIYSITGGVAYFILFIIALYLVNRTKNK